MASEARFASKEGYVRRVRSVQTSSRKYVCSSAPEYGIGRTGRSGLCRRARGPGLARGSAYGRRRRDAPNDDRGAPPGRPRGSQPRGSHRWRLVRLVGTGGIDGPAWTLGNSSYTFRVDCSIRDESSSSCERHRKKPKGRRNRSTALGEPEFAAVEREPHDQSERHRGGSDIWTKPHQRCSVLSMSGQDRPGTYGCGGRDHRKSVRPRVPVERRRKGRNRQGGNASAGESKASDIPRRVQSKSGHQIAGTNGRDCSRHHPGIGCPTGGQLADRVAKGIVRGRLEHCGDEEADDQQHGSRAGAHHRPPGDTDARRVLCAWVERPWLRTGPPDRHLFHLVVRDRSLLVHLRVLGRPARYFGPKPAGSRTSVPTHKSNGRAGSQSGQPLIPLAGVAGRTRTARKPTPALACPRGCTGRTSYCIRNL